MKAISNINTCGNININWNESSNVWYLVILLMKVCSNVCERK